MTHPFVNCQLHRDCSDSDHGRPPLPADIKGNHSQLCGTMWVYVGLLCGTITAPTCRYKRQPFPLLFTKASCKNSNSQSGEVGTLQKQAPPNLPFGETQLRPFCPTNKKKRALPTHLPGNWMQPRWRDAVIPVGGVVVVVVVVTKLLVTPWCTLLCFYLAHLNI